MLSRVIAVAAAAASANALQACIWLGNPECPSGASFVCKDMPDGECVEVLGIPGTNIYGKFTDQDNGQASVSVHLNSEDCTTGEITDDVLLGNGYDYEEAMCSAAATVAGQTAYIKTTGNFGADSTGSADSTEETTDEDTEANPVPVADDITQTEVTPVADETVQDPAAVGGINSILSMLAGAGLPEGFVMAFKDVIGDDSGAFLSELGDVDIPGLLGSFSNLPSMSEGGAAAGEDGLPTIPDWVQPFAEGIKANVHQDYTDSYLDALTESSITSLTTNCRGYFDIYGEASPIGMAIAGSDSVFGNNIESMLGVNPQGLKCAAGSEAILYQPCSIGFLETGVEECSVDLCCADAGTKSEAPMVAQILSEIVTRVLQDLMAPIMMDAIPYLRAGVVSMANSDEGELNVLTNCGLIFHYAEMLQLEGMTCKHKHQLDKFQPCATKPNLASNVEPWGKCGRHECCGKGMVQSKIGRTIASLIAYEEAKILELLSQQLTIILGATSKTNAESGKFLITCKQWKNFLGGKCHHSQKDLDEDMFCSTYSFMSFGVHKCSRSICCGNESSGFNDAALAVGIAAGKLYEFSEIAKTSNHFVGPQYALSCGKYAQQWGLRCPVGGRLDKGMPCLMSSFEHKSSFYKCTPHNCCGSFSKNYTPASVFDPVIKDADEAADVFFAISQSDVAGLFELNWSNTQFAVNCETWAAIPGWGYKADPICAAYNPNSKNTTTTGIHYDVSCPNITPQHRHFQPLVPCRSLAKSSRGGVGKDTLFGAIPACEAVCFTPGVQKHLAPSTLLAAQTVAYPVQLVYLLTHMVQQYDRAVLVAKFLSSFAGVIKGDPVPALDMAAFVKALGPSVPTGIDALLSGAGLNGTLPEVLAAVGKVLPGLPLLPLDGLLMNCGAWAENLDMNYFGHGTCTTGRPVDHNLPCWVSSKNKELQRMYKVNIMPNVGDCSPEYCCSCRTKAKYSTANARVLGNAGAEVTKLFLKSTITPLMFKIGRVVADASKQMVISATGGLVQDVPAYDHGHITPPYQIGFGASQIYMPFTGFGSKTELNLGPMAHNIPVAVGELIIGNEFCIKSSKYPDGTLPTYEQDYQLNSYINGTMVAGCTYWGGEM